MGEGESSGDDSSSKIYPDVNGDGRVTSGDANLVLIAMMENSYDGEGEQLVRQLNDDAVAANPIDNVFADLGNGDMDSVEKIAITDCPKAPEVLDPAESALSGDVRDDEEENGLLDLLAGDIDQIWG